MLRFGSFEGFRAEVLSGFPSRPKSFTHIIATNLRGAGLLDCCAAERALGPEAFDRAMQSGAVVIDTRDGSAFGGLHIPGSVNIGFESQLANWVGMVVDPEADILLVTQDRKDYERMTTELHRIGYDRIAGYLSGGVPAWLMSGRPVARLDQIDPLQLGERLARDGVRVIDVRTPGERAESRIEGAEHLPLAGLLEGRLPEPGPGGKDEEIVVHCRSGYRSNIAGSILRRSGYTRVSSLAGGTLAWASAGLPLAAS
jgi:rhodanese-related sulfurtransferase